MSTVGEHGTAVRTQSCPECGEAVPMDARFGAWCDACDWNVDSAATKPGPGRIEALRRRLAQRHGQELLEEMREDTGARPRRDTSSLLAHIIALAVHGFTLALAVVGVLLVVLGWSTVSQPVVGTLLLLLAIGLRPRFAKLPDYGTVLHRPDAPRLFALIDEVAAAVGTTGVHTVVIGPQANASVGTFGVRQRRVLHLGLGLWEILTPQERVALLGHELGHYANGDLRHAKIVGTALSSLSLWCYVLAPTRSPSFLERVANALMSVPRGLAHGLLVLLDHVTLRASQRAEYLADRAASAAASTTAVTALMDRLLVCDTVDTELRRESVTAQTGIGGTKSRGEAWQGLWERLAAHIASVPEREFERLRRAGALRGHSVDSTHPPTHLRRRLVVEGEDLPARVRVDDLTAAAIAAELADPRNRLARTVIRDYAG
ncbi:M48 family metalloprotease [Streptomyces sp. NBC_00663]|uniref:M48 family metalloprotease n=1 Tax=Streptomyces sp. NBC_00663 TaxID=2975801 RepID=UPI002E37E7BA|nr:M48 family metalloprotease [Streptomyces sp. NBC_00663]